MKNSSNKASAEAVDTMAVESGNFIFELDEKVDRDFVRTISLSDCPIENMSLCSSFRSNRSKRRKSVFVYNHWEGVDNKKSNNTDDPVTCTLYKVQESPMSERKTVHQVNFNRLLLEPSTNLFCVTFL